MPIPDSVKPKAIQQIHTLSPEEFEKLIGKMTPDPATQATLIPGTRLGRPVFGVPVRPIDVVWVGLSGPLWSKHAIEELYARNVKLDTVEVEATTRGKAKHRFFSIIPLICEVLDQDWLSRELVQCPACHQWKCKPGRRLPTEVLVSKAHVVAKRWPKGCHFVYSPSLMALLYSPEFAEAFQDANLLGAEFKQTTWV